MPIYEFQCSKCSHCFEKLCGMTQDEAKICCPNCGANDPEKKLSLFSGKKNCSSCSGGSCSSCG